ncbi:hypothetical protein WDW86_11000 [Bdellovibrionota bacterium FG-2]
MIKSIARATHEQSMGVGQIKIAMNQIEQSTIQNSEVSNKSSQMAKQLTDQSKNLNTIVFDLGKLIEGTDGPRA